MTAAVLGILILVLPFCLVLCAENRIQAFLRVLAASTLFHLAVALVTQYLRIFRYSTVIYPSVAFAIVCAFIFLKKMKESRQIGSSLLLPARDASHASLAWIVIAAAVVLFELSSPHYHYTGPVKTINGTAEVTNSIYLYPYFSDEWADASLVDYSLRTGSLPFAIPFIPDSSFLNPLAGFFSIVAELCVLLALPPLAAYPLFAVLASLLISVLVALCVRSWGGSPFAAACAALSVPLMVSGSNFGGIWYLLPITGGLLFLLVAISSVSFKDIKLFTISCLVALMLYPPIAVFIVPLAIISFASSSKNRKLKPIMFTLLGLIAAGLVVFMILAARFSLNESWASLIGFLFRDNATGGIPSFIMWYILPLPILVAAAIGTAESWVRARWAIFVPLILGLIWWAANSFTAKTVVIDYARVVFVTSVLLCVCAGFGIELLIKKIGKSAGESWGHVFEWAIMSLFIWAALLYPGNAWKHLTLDYSPSTIQPYPSANRYLTSDDLRLFAGIHEKIFIAPPWKGLVIGVALHNYPLETTNATIAARVFRYEDFMVLDCAGKSAIARLYQVDYVYSKPFLCPGFSEMDTSGEGLHLYRFIATKSSL